MDSKATQKTQQAGRTKMTAVTVRFCGTSKVFFLPLVHNERGEATLPESVREKLLDQCPGIRGTCYSIG